MAASRFGAQADEGVHWDYHSHGGPEGWPHLPEPASETPAFPDCALDRQSPVDIPRRAPLSAGLLLDYQPSRLAVTNNGHTIQVPYEAGSAMTAAGKTYRLLQFHFHAPSEHLIHGRPAAMEAHFVHQAAGGELAVLGVLIVEGGPHQALQYILDVMPADQATVGASREIDAGAFMPDDLSYYAYEGSLTTPPCTEGVMWHVLRKPITASPQQVEAFRSLPFLSPEGDFVGNARPVQPLNGRPGEQAAPPLMEGPISPPATGSAGLASR